MVLFIVLIIFKSFSFSGDEKDIAGHCKSLVSLNVMYTRVTDIGIRLALQHLANLNILVCYNSVQVASEMFREVRLASPQHESSQQSNNATNRRSSLSLMDLHCAWKGSDPNPSPYVGGSLAHAIQLCPSVAHVVIDIFKDKIVQDADLQALLNLENLRHLVLGNILSISFDEGILPLLEKFGRESLEVLELSWLKDVDVAAVLRTGSNLRSLAMDEIYQYKDSSSSADAVYQLPHLKNLAISRTWSYLPEERRGQPTSDSLSLLLQSCPALVSLHLAEMDELTDEVFEDAASAHDFSQLEKLSLYECRTITRATVDLFLLTLECPFKSISFDFCDEIFDEVEQEDHDLWWETASKNNWELSMDVCSSG